MHHYKPFKGGPLFNFGSAPKIDGGMTEEQYRQLQLEEQQFQAKLEDEKYNRAMEYEESQREYESAREEKLAAQKGAEELAIQQGELAIQGEITAQDEEEEEADNMGAGGFAEALAKNNTINPRPE